MDHTMNDAVLQTVVIDGRTGLPLPHFLHYLRGIRERVVVTAVLTINGILLTEANFSDTEPPPPTGGVNLTWAASSPNISAHLRPNDVSDTLLRDSAALSVIGRAAQTGGDPADIAAEANTVLGRTAGDLAFAAVANAQMAPMPAFTVKGNHTVNPAVPADLTRAHLLTLIGRQLVTLPSDAPFGSVVPADVPGLAFSVLAGHYYALRFLIIARSSVASIGVRLGLTRPAATVYAATVRGFEASPGSGVEYQAPLSASGDSAAPLATPVANTDYLYSIDALIAPSADGTVQVQAGLEIGGGTVTIRQGSIGILQEVF